MWYKIEEIETKYGLSKFSIYALITQEPELRKYIKALEGVLQINEQGISVLLKHATKKAEDEKPSSYADNNTIIMHRDGPEKTIQAPELKKEVEDEDNDLFGDAFNRSGSFFDDEPAKESTVDAPKEDFFSSLNFEAEAQAPIVEAPVSTSPVEDFSADDLIFQDSPGVLDDLSEADEVNPEVFDDMAHVDDFFSDYAVEEEEYLSSPDIVTEISTATEDEYTMEGYIKSLKEKMIIQNEQIRALSTYLDVSRKLLIQDEKIVGILEGMYREK